MPVTTGIEIRDGFEAAQARRQWLRAVLSGTVGTAIEWYDFFLYGTMAALVFPRVFFPKSDPVTGLLASFATFSVGFVARPLGAALFGHLGDRIGRRSTLVTTLVVMGMATGAMGLLPGYDRIGPWSAVLLAALRFVQGLGVGGEWGGSVLLSMEWSRPGRRGFAASLPQIGVPVGLVLSNAALLTAVGLTGAGFYSWGWRLPFLAGMVLLGIGYAIRLGVWETPVFARLREERRIETMPVSRLWRRGLRPVILTALVMTPVSISFYLFVTWSISYGTAMLGLDSNLMLYGLLLAAALQALSIPFFGRLSDHSGRRLVLLFGFAAQVLVAVPYFLLLNSRVPVLVVLAMMVSLIPMSIGYAAIGALIPESFPAAVRYSGSSLGYHLAGIIGGGPAPSMATFLVYITGDWRPIAGYLVGSALIGVAAVLLLPDRTRVRIDP